MRTTITYIDTDTDTHTHRRTDIYVRFRYEKTTITK